MLDTFLEWAVVAFPFLLSIAGVLVSINAPKSCHRRWWYAGLICFGLMTSAAVFWQQLRSRSAHNKEIRQVADQLARIERYTSQIPQVVIPPKQALIGNNKPHPGPVVFLGCDWMMAPITLPASTQLTVLSPSIPPSVNGITPLTVTQMPADRAILWPSEKMKASTMLYRCVLVNYSNSPMFRIAGIFSTKIFNVATKPDGGTEPGSVETTKTHELNIPNLDGGGGKFLFYVDNDTDKFLSVELPTSVSYQLGDSLPRRSIKLIRSAPPDNNMLWFGPSY